MSTADAVAAGDLPLPPAPWYGVLLYHLVPVRRRTILANLRRVFGARMSEPAIRQMAQAHYAHLARSLLEVAAEATRAAPPPVRVENLGAVVRAGDAGRGVLVLAAHVGNWEVAVTRGIAQFPRYHGKFHFLRRPLFPAALDRFVTRRFRRAGLGVLPKKGALDRILACLANNDGIIFLLDQYAAGRDGVEVEFFGTPTGTFRSLAIIARSTGAPVVPATTWRAADGTHVLRFEEPLAPIACADPGEWIRVNTGAYNRALEQAILQHPEQWFWAHRRWK